MSMIRNMDDSKRKVWNQLELKLREEQVSLQRKREEIEHELKKPLNSLKEKLLADHRAYGHFGDKAISRRSYRNELLASIKKEEERYLSRLKQHKITNAKLYRKLVAKQNVERRKGGFPELDPTGRHYITPKTATSSVKMPRHVKKTISGR